MCFDFCPSVHGVCIHALHEGRFFSPPLPPRPRPGTASKTPPTAGAAWRANLCLPRRCAPSAKAHRPLTRPQQLNSSSPQFATFRHGEGEADTQVRSGQEDDQPAGRPQVRVPSEVAAEALTASAAIVPRRPRSPAAESTRRRRRPRNGRNGMRMHRCATCTSRKGAVAAARRRPALGSPVAAAHPPHPPAPREQVPSALFFRYNTALGPPYHVLLDTNFINFSIKNKLEVVGAMMDCLLAKCTSMAEVGRAVAPLGARRHHLRAHSGRHPLYHGLRDGRAGEAGPQVPHRPQVRRPPLLAARCSLLLTRPAPGPCRRLAKDPRFQRLRCSHSGTYADDCLCQRVKEVRHPLPRHDHTPRGLIPHPTPSTGATSLPRAIGT